MSRTAKQVRLERIVRPQNWLCSRLHVGRTFNCEIALPELRIQPMEVNLQAKIIKRSSVVFGAVGLCLLVLMVTTEGEPGALPLGLLLISIVGYAIARIKDKTTKEIGPEA